MATSFIDLQRVIGLIHGDILSIGAITTIADVQRQHEPAGDGVTKPALSILGIDGISFPLRAGATAAGDAGGDECAFTLQLLVQHTIDDYTTNHYAAEGIVSLLRKHLETRSVQDSTAAVPSSGEGSAQTGHHVRYCVGSPRPMRVQSGNGPGDEEGQTIRVFVVEIDCIARRTGTSMINGG